ncbi:MULTISPECIES: collagenase ColA [Bacillus]|uniref:microbial collagenase n=1 Tax=Bacillus pseudomycoides TaxID=64104 RepID=A0AAJ2DJD6_9BACI|nr:collagenase ColA [Bacillus pseudomycoides]KFN13254.1 collagenase family protein [Bacillus pseudomycoides]MCR8856657.1 collagenase [Bacillus pseudomycoides]MDR4187920.1 collagenase [Bacillus pseudomycoides]MDR4325645.1 collagenase [Bacillus pseudomycoides]MED0857391.1 collagenase [Bacillus pseudomycoides]
MVKYSKFYKLMLGVGLVTISCNGLQVQAETKEKYTKNTLQMEPIGLRQSPDELAHSSNIQESTSFTKRLKLADLSQRPPMPKENTKQLVEERKYSMAELNQLSNKQLADLLVTIKWNQIPELFQFNNDSLKFYQDNSRMQALIDKLAEQGQTYTKDDSKGVETLVEVIRSGFYLGFYHQELSKLSERSYHDKCLPALKTIAKNPNFKLGTSEQNKVISSYGMLIGGASADVEIIQYAAGILKQYNDNFSTFIEDRTKGDAIYNLMKEIDYDVQSYMYTTDKEPKDTMWYKNIDSFINEVSRFALIGTVTDKNGWLINNGIYYASRFGKFHSTPTKGQQVVTEAMRIYPYLGQQYFVAAEQITTNYGGVDANGKTINLDKIREDGKQKYLPKTYTFDDGAIVFKAGDKVTEEKIKRLYWAAKEVKAQFYRTVGSNKPLESGHADDVLTMVIYNSPDEYQFNRQLYGYETNNGGIYIEGIGTFFTYERTPQQSIYSLEELFRHEFTHYLQGRYEVPGLWGQGELYQNERLTWFEEGNAEFFAGSTRVDSVVPRKSIIGGLSNDPAKRYTAEQTLNAKYGAWDFYNYSFALQSYMYNNRPDMFDKVHDLIRANDVPGYDVYRSALSKDNKLNEDYQSYMQMLINNRDKYTIPQVSDDYLARHKLKALSNVAADITNEAKLKNVKVTKNKSQFFNTFTLQGTYTGSTSKGENEDWKAMNQATNEMLKHLSQKEWSGYKTLTAYFVNYRVNAAGQFEYDIVFNGVNTEEDTSVEKEPNNSFDTANPLSLNTLLRGSLNNQDQVDRFVIDIREAKDLQITVTNEQNLGLNWVLYQESDLNNYVTYATKYEGNKLLGSYYANLGKYYLSVYKYGSGTGNYTIEVK